MQTRLALPGVSPPPDAGYDVAWTPSWTTRCLVAHIADELRGTVAWEMHAGGGAFLQPLNRLCTEVLATEIDARAFALTSLHSGSTWSQAWDALRGLPEGWPPPAWVVGNPPWSTVLDHLAVAMDEAQQGIAWVLQAGREHRTEWLPIFRRAMFDECIALGRVSFEGPGRGGRQSATTDCAAYIWRRDPDGGWNGRGLMRILDSRGRVLKGRA